MELLGTDFPYSENSLHGKHALICGASKGIGSATAKMMAKAGANVSICARNKEALTELLGQLNLLGNGKHQMFVIDLEDSESLSDKIDSVLSEQGPIHILVNNSGGPPGGPLLSNNIEDFEAPFKRHLHASHILVTVSYTHLTRPTNREV